MQDKQNGNPKIKVIFQQFFFLTVFRHFFVSEYYKYSRTARNIVRFTTGMIALQKAADHLRTGAGISSWSITDALFSPTTPAELTRLYFFYRNLNGR